MNQLNLSEVSRYVEENIGTFHQKRIASLDDLKLSRVIKRKNPYLLKAKNVLTAEQIVKSMVDAHISSSEEGIFGDWLEGLVIFINKQVFGGWKSGISGIDLEFDKDGVRYIVTIKSSPNWGNSKQVAKMIADFNTARKILRTSNSQLNVIAVNGCCSGADNKPDKNGVYFKYCGQRFWEFISGNENLYLDIIEPLGHTAKKRNEEFIVSYSKMLNRFTREFTTEFCLDDGSIDWTKLVKFNSLGTASTQSRNR
jgi:hypothetical protein